MTNNLKKRKFLATSLTATMVATAVAPVAGFAAEADKTFPDVPETHWAADAINYLVGKGAINGLPDGTYGPTQDINRAAVAKMIAESLENIQLVDGAKPSFSDVPASHYAAKHIAALEEAGIIDGNDKGLFNPSGNLSREAAAKMVVEAYGLKLDENADISFPDNTSWGANYINIAASLGVLTGTDKGLANPTGNLSRAALAQLVHRAEVKDARAEVPQKGEVEIGDWDLRVVAKDGAIEANGVDNTTVTFQIIDKNTGKVDVNANDIVLDLNTTYGSLAQKRATIQNGEVTVVLRSEFNAKGVTAKVEAQIIEASGDYKELIGKLAGSANVIFKAPGSAEVDAVYLTAANTNEADRVTLTFDKAVSVSDFVETDENGNLTGKLRTDNKVAISQTVSGKDLAVKGFLPGPTQNTLVAVLDVTEGAVNKANVLTDNADVKAVVTMINTAGQETKSEQDFKFTDSRLPQVTSLKSIGMNKVEVKFSEPIASADFKINGYYDERHFDAKYGKFEFNTVTKQFVDNRSVVTLSLKDTYKENGQDTIEGYFTANNHALQVSTIKDFAALSDNNNIGSTQNLVFKVDEIKALALPGVKVDSPNQYRITLDKNAVLKTTDNNSIELQVYDNATKTWVAADAGRGDLKAKPNYDVNPIKGDTDVPQYKVEVNSVWTQVYQTATTNNNYYNDQYRLVIKKGQLKTSDNGKTNAADIELPLNFTGSAMNTPDTTSPVISSVEEATNKDKGIYLVTMSEPVTGDLAKVVEFIGKDKDGKVRTYKGVATERHGDGLDNKFYVDTNIKSTSTDKTEYELIKDLVLSGGSEDWTLVLKDVTDDIGNKAATVTKDFKITAKQVAGKFQVLRDGEKGPFLVTGNKGATETVTITFTENVALTGKGSAIDTANYSLNGADLPAGSTVALASGSDGKPVDNKVVITVKDGTLKDGSNIITLGKNLESKDGKVLTGQHAFTFNVDFFKSPEQVQAEAVINEINALGPVDALTLADEAKVNVAVANYNNLSAAAKALVPADVKAKLDAAVAKIAELKGEEPVKTVEQIDGLVEQAAIPGAFRVVIELAKLDGATTESTVTLEIEGKNDVVLTYSDITDAFRNNNIQGYTIDELKQAKVKIN